MIEFDIPGRGVIHLQHLVSDVSGILAVDGRLIDDTSQSLLELPDRL